MNEDQTTTATEDEKKDEVKAEEKTDEASK